MVLKNKKALKLVVCMSLIVALAISALGISVWATYENTHYNSGDQANDIVGVAQTQVGYSEGYDGYTKYGDWYGLPNSDWCAMFVSWCANQAGVDNSVFPSFALCSAGCDWFIQQGRFHYSGSYIPQAGDLIFYSSWGNIYHVGLVTGSDGSNVYSIEGNYNEMVTNVSYSLGYGDILGYATPAYSTSGSTSADTYEDVNYDENYIENSDIADIETDTYFDTDNEETVETDTYLDDNISSDSTYEEEEYIDSSIDSEEEYVEISTDSEEEYVEISTDSEEDYLTESTDSEESFVENITDTESAFAEEDTDSEEDVANDETAAFIIMGDVNGDGLVDSHDALLVQRFLILGSADSEINMSNADVNGSGNVDIGDAFMILKMSVGLI